MADPINVDITHSPWSWVNLRTAHRRGLWPYSPDPVPPACYPIGVPATARPVILTGNSLYELHAVYRTLASVGVWALAVETGGEGLWQGHAVTEVSVHRLTDLLTTHVEPAYERRLLVPYPLWTVLSARRFTPPAGWQLVAAPAHLQDLSAFWAQGEKLSEGMQLYRARFQDYLARLAPHLILFTGLCSLVLLTALVTTPS